MFTLRSPLSSRFRHSQVITAADRESTCVIDGPTQWDDRQNTDSSRHEFPNEDSPEAHNVPAPAPQAPGSIPSYPNAIPIELVTSFETECIPEKTHLFGNDGLNASGITILGDDRVRQMQGFPIVRPR